MKKMLILYCILIFSLSVNLSSTSFDVLGPNFILTNPQISSAKIFKNQIIFVQIYKFLLIFPEAAEENLHFSKDFHVEWDREFDDLKLPNNNCVYKRGFVQNNEENKATISICNNRTFLRGYFQFNENSYFFLPLNNKKTQQHKLYKTRKIYNNLTTKKNRPKRSVSANFDWLFNLTGDTFENFNTDQNKLTTTNAKKKILLENYSINDNDADEEENNGYFYDSAFSATSILAKSDLFANNINSNNLPTKWLEIAIGVDNSVISFHGKLKVQQYILALMNIVNTIFQDSSLNANLKLVISRLIFYKNHKHHNNNNGIIRAGNAKKSLENVNLWNKKLYSALKPDQSKHDIAIWLTRLDIGGPSGYAPVAGVCDPKRSCALNKDEGLTSAFIIAHEIAHMLGLTHDGDSPQNNCSNEAAEGSVMAAMVSATFSKFSWSECSKNEYNQKIGNWTCLRNKPKNAIKLNSTLQTAFTMDEQCRMEFGEDYTMCRAFDITEPCSHLWCGNVKQPLVCKTKKGAPLEGTDCGFGKWCIGGYCTDIPQSLASSSDFVPIALNPQNGKWSEWSVFGPCSRTCGLGVQYRHRICNNPMPSYGGKNCEGPMEEFQLCNKTLCPKKFIDLKADQCKIIAKILNSTEENLNSTNWIPFENPTQEDSNLCKFSCVNENTKELLILNENWLDGTPCSYSNNEDNICIQGKCYRIGCDLKINSTKNRDQCGVCAGNGSTCINKNITLKRKLNKEMKKISVLPREARHIKIETNITKNTNVAFVLKNRQKRSYTLTIPNTSVNSKIIEGTNFFYKKIDEKSHILWSPGPVLSEIIILILPPPKELNESIQFTANTQYSIEKRLLGLQKFIWILGGWGSCSVSCDGGKRQKTFACFDQQLNKIVKKRFCSILERPKIETELCNEFKCNFEWVPGKWEPCSTSCGKNGLQYREIYCLPSDFASVSKSLEIFQNMVNPNKCLNFSKPISTQSCSQVPCPYFWEYGAWSECSTSCGNGFSSRTAKCPAKTDGLCMGPSLEPQKRICNENNKKLCKKLKNNNNNNNKINCQKDDSKYCAFDLLKRYCQLKSFRRLCCESCSSSSIA